MTVLYITAARNQIDCYTFKVYYQYITVLFKHVRKDYNESHSYK